MRTKRNVLYFGVILFMLTMLSGCKEPVTPPPVDNTVQVTVKFTFEGTSIKDHTFKSDKNKSYTDRQLFDIVSEKEAALKKYILKSPEKENKVGSSDISFTVELKVEPENETVQVAVKFTFEGTSIKDHTFKSDKNKSYTDKQLFDMASAEGNDLKEYTVKNPEKENKTGSSDISFTVELNKQITQLTFNFEEILNGGVEYTFKLTPSINTAYYYTGIIQKYVAENKHGGIQGLHEMDKKWWRFVADNNNKDWKEIMRSDVSKGEKTFNSRNNFENYLLHWDIDYYVYYYGIDTVTGEQITETFVKDIHTKKPDVSTNKFEVKIKKIYKDAVEADITTTNNDQYVVRCETKKYVDWYKNKTDLIDGIKPMDLMIHKFIYNAYSENEQNKLFHQGNSSIDRNTQILKSANTDYYIIVFGFNGGITTDITLIPFTTLPAQ